MTQQASHRPFFSGQFSLGNISTIVAAIVAVSIAWGSLNSRVEELETSIDDIEAGTKRNTFLIHANEMEIARQDERTNSILTGITRIERQLQRLDEKISNRTNASTK